MQTDQGFDQIETKFKHCQEIVSDKGNPPFQSRQRCFSDILSLEVCVCFPPFPLIRRVLRQVTQDKFLKLNNDSNMIRPTMVCRDSKNVCRKLNTSIISQRSPERSCREVEFTQNNLRQNLLAESISERSSNLITNNARTSSTKNYKSAWRKRCSRYSKQKVSHARSDINVKLDFLSELFENGLKYRTIET